MAARKGYTAPLAREGACDPLTSWQTLDLAPLSCPPGQGRDLRKNVQKRRTSLQFRLGVGL